MDAKQWAMHDQLRVSFAKILFAWQHPVVLSDSPDEDFEEQRNRQIFQYFNTDPMAHHVLQSLVHAAIAASKSLNIQ